MTFILTPKSFCFSLISFLIISTLSFASFSESITPADLLKNLEPGEPWDKTVLTATKAATFTQTLSGETDATTIADVTLSYFASADCSGVTSGSSSSYTTSSGPSFTISVGTSFGFVAAAAWDVGTAKLGISSADMTNNIASIAVTLKATSSNTPQAAFDGTGNTISYACLPVSCSVDACTGGGSHDFTLKTTAAVGDPADGGVIGCQNTGIDYNKYDLVVTTSDQSTGEAWGGAGTPTDATSTVNGFENTQKIVAAVVGASAAKTCDELSIDGGFNSDWFLPAGTVTDSQMNCIYNNRTAITTGSVAAGGSGFTNTGYWSSTEQNASNAFRMNLVTSSQGSNSKGSSFRVRCAREY